VKLEIGEAYILEEDAHSPYKMIIYPFKRSGGSESYIALKYTDRIKYGGWHTVLVPYETTRNQRESFSPFDARAAIIELFGTDIVEKIKI
jgi:hypothetical protein